MLSPEEKQKILEYELYMSRKKFEYINKETLKDKLKRWCCCSNKYDLS
jgi:hypothetical protein